MRHARWTVLAVLALAALLGGCCSSPRPAAEEARVDTKALAALAGAVLDDLHAAAAAADEQRYFGHFAADGVFLGTDATERWTVEAFRAYARPHFQKGKGWTYRVSGRHLDVARDGSYAWFDESLENAGLGACRGSGVLRREGGAWKVVQYNLTIPVPNELADELTARIKARLKRP